MYSHRTAFTTICCACAFYTHRQVVYVYSIHTFFKKRDAQAQVARSMAGLLSIIREDVTPKQLMEILRANLRLSNRIYGSAIAFEPDSYPWFNGSLTPSFPSLSEGVPSYSGDYMWNGATEPYTLVPQEVWTGEKRVLYSPYVANSGIISMDLADSYNYFANGTEWYHLARTRFLRGELSFLEGVWGSPYFDEGAGEICMITFSVPFTRQSPVPPVPVPDWLEPSSYGLLENQAIHGSNGLRYFWGIATVDIDLSIVSYTCDPSRGAEEGSVFNNETRRCEKCPKGSQLYNGNCARCYEYEYSLDDRSQCLLSEMYLVYGFFFHLWLAIVILPAGLKVAKALLYNYSKARHRGWRVSYSALQQARHPCEFCQEGQDTSATVYVFIWSHCFGQAPGLASFQSLFRGSVATALGPKATHVQSKALD